MVPVGFPPAPPHQGLDRRQGVAGRGRIEFVSPSTQWRAGRHGRGRSTCTFRRISRVALGAASALALSAGVAAGASPATAHGRTHASRGGRRGSYGGGGHRPTLQRPGGRPFLPILGDWEGETDGFHASFELVYRPRLVGFHGVPYGVENLVPVLPTGCPPEPAYNQQETVAELLRSRRCLSEVGLAWRWRVA